MENTSKIGIIISSIRENRFGDKAAQWIYDIAKNNSELEVELIDLREWNFPLFAEGITPSTANGTYTNPLAQKWADKIKSLDGFIWVCAEYNHGYTSALKNALDYVYKEWHRKPVAFVGYGSAGGARAVEQLRQVAVELQMAPLRYAVHIMDPWFLLNEDGSLKTGALDSYASAAERTVDDLAWWTKALKEARNK